MAKLQKITNQTTPLLEGVGVELTVNFSAEWFPPSREEGHGLHEIEGMWLITLDDVVLSIDGNDCSILSFLSPQQKASVVNRINVEELCSI